MNSVVHFEIPAGNLKRAKNFYKDVFDWEIVDMPEMSYVIVRTTETDKNQMPKKTGAINGGMMKRSAKIKSPVITIHVPSVDGHIKKIVKAGGKVIMPKVPVGDMGFSAYVKDTEGNVVGLWQALRK